MVSIWTIRKMILSEQFTYELLILQVNSENSKIASMPCQQEN